MYNLLLISSNDASTILSQARRLADDNDALRAAAAEAEVAAALAEATTAAAAAAEAAEAAEAAATVVEVAPMPVEVAALPVEAPLTLVKVAVPVEVAPTVVEVAPVVVAPTAVPEHAADWGRVAVHSSGRSSMHVPRAAVAAIMLFILGLVVALAIGWSRVRM